MSWFKRNRKLIEYDPSELDVEMLSHLRASLLAKLVLVNKELIQRYRDLVEIGTSVAGTDEARHTLSKSADHLQAFGVSLEHELSRIACTQDSP